MKKKVYAYLHTHWDREWYRDKEDFNLRFLEVFDIVLDELKNNKAPFFYLDGQVIALLDYLKYRKDKKEEIIELIKNKKLAIGPYFASIDSYLVNFNSILKNLDLGLKISKSFNQKEFIGYLSDIFGISKSVFTALNLKNIDKAIIWRGVNPKKINNNCNFLLDNIKTTWLVKGYFNDFFHSEEPNIEGIKKYLDDISKYSATCCLLPIGADHLGMLKNANEKIKEVNEQLKDYEIILTSPFEYFKHTKFDNISKEEEFLDNSDTYILPGVYSARIPQKIKNFEVMNKLSRIIEPLNFYLKDKYIENIDFIWETLIKNYAHDGIYGCSIDDVHKTIDYRLLKCENALNAIEKRLIGNFKEKYKIKEKTKDKIGFFNLTNNDNIKVIKVKTPYIIENSQIIKKEKGFEDELLYDVYKIPVTEDITTLYTQLIETDKNNKFEFNTIKIQKPTKKTTISEKSIENDFIKLEIKNKKIILLNKKTKEKNILKLTDIADTGDSYNFAPKGDYEILNPIKTKIIENGLIESVLRIYFKNVELDVILNNFSKFVSFKAKINNKKKNHKLQFVIETFENIKKTISQDVMGIIKRNIDYKYKMQDFMPVKRPYELKTNSYPMQNFVCANKLGVLTKGLNEYEIYNNELRICLLRSFSTISNPKNPARSIPAGPDLKTPEAQILYEYEAEFAIFFGNEKQAFEYLEIFLENYVVIDGCYKKEINFKLDEIPKNSYILGINNNKKISYNVKENTVSLI